MSEIGDEIHARLPKIVGDGDFHDPIYGVNQRIFANDEAFLSGGNYDSFKNSVKSAFAKIAKQREKLPYRTFEEKNFYADGKRGVQKN